MFTRISNYGTGQDHTEVGWKNPHPALDDIKQSSGDKPTETPVFVAEVEHDENEQGVMGAITVITDRIKLYEEVSRPKASSPSAVDDPVDLPAGPRPVKRIDYATLAVSGRVTRAMIPEVVRVLNILKAEYEDRLVDKHYKA